MLAGGPALVAHPVGKGLDLLHAAVQCLQLLVPRAKLGGESRQIREAVDAKRHQRHLQRRAFRLEVCRQRVGTRLESVALVTRSQTFDLLRQMAELQAELFPPRSTTGGSIEIRDAGTLQQVSEIRFRLFQLALEPLRAADLRLDIDCTDPINRDTGALQHQQPGIARP
jgi:hypothetical protein